MCAGHDPQPGPDRLRTFEEIYVQAGRDFTAIPWAALAPLLRSRIAFPFLGRSDRARLGGRRHGTTAFAR